MEVREGKKISPWGEGAKNATSPIYDPHGIHYPQISNICCVLPPNQNLVLQFLAASPDNFRTIITHPLYRDNIF